MKDLLFALIGIVVSLAIVWLIGSFIAWDLLWFIHSWGGRIIAMLFFIIIVISNIKEME